MIIQELITVAVFIKFIDVTSMYIAYCLLLIVQIYNCCYLLQFYFITKFYIIKSLSI